jgi:hypothetical protein
MANLWLRLWHDMPNDPKWRTISRASGQPIALVEAIYIHLLVDASRNVTRGHVSVTPEDLASALDVTEADVESVLAAMQGRVLDGVQVSGWDARQPKREDSGNPETGAKSASQRKREQREREKAKAQDDSCHARSRTVTTDKDKEEDKDKSKEQEPPLPPKGEAVAAAPGKGEPSANPVKPSPKFDPMSACPPNVTPEIWQSWVKCRKEQGKPLKQTTCEAQAKQLADHPNPDEVIRRSIAAGWQGLFPERVGTTSAPGPVTSRHHGFEKRDYHDGLILREDGTYGI